MIGVSHQTLKVFFIFFIHLLFLISHKLLDSSLPYSLEQSLGIGKVLCKGCDRNIVGCVVSMLKWSNSTEQRAASSRLAGSK